MTMNEQTKHGDIPPEDRHRKATRQIDLLPCRLCRSRAELWQRWLRDDVWENYVSCTNEKDVDGEPCQFYVPESADFYCDRRMQAAQYWNLIMGPRVADETTDEDKADLLSMAAVVARAGRETNGVKAELMQRASRVLVALAETRQTRRHRGCGPGCTLPAGHLGDHSPVEPEVTACHPDPTGKTREPPHCPTCSCPTAGEISVMS